MKHLAKIASLMLALVMVVCCAVPVFAVNTETTPNQNAHTITITNAREGHTYEAYQVFRGDISDGKLTNITWGTGVNGTALLAALKETTDFANCTSAEEVAEVVAGFESNSEKLDAFAEVVGAHLSGTTASATAADGATSVTINVTGDGYYLLKDKDKSLVGEEGEAYTKYILRVVTDVNVTAKADVPELDKKIVGVDGNEITATTATSASIGDSIKFELTSEVPEMDGYDSYIFTVHDTLSAGLTFNNDVNVVLGSGDTATTLRADVYDADNDAVYEKDYAVSVNGQKITIEFHNMIARKDQKGTTITITYSATLNEKAVVSSDGNKNKAYLQYSNDPNWKEDGDNKTPPTGETPKEEVEVYTTGLKLTKTSEKTAEGVKLLTGAKFKIEGKSANVTLINKEVFVVDSNGTYWRLTNGTYTTTDPAGEGVDTTAYESTTTKYSKVNEVVKSTGEETGLVKEGWVNDKGVISFTGLGAGEYTITELVSPAGYNLLKEPVTVKIEWSADDGWTITVDNSEEALEVDTDGYYYFDVVNKAGVTLPATGGIGTTIFYVLGTILALGAVVVLVVRKRMRAEA